MSKKIKEKIGVDELKDRKGRIWKALLAEFIGTFLLNFFGCGSCLNLGVGPSVERISFAFGLAIMAGVQALGHVSGAHLNPAVTLACLITCKTPLIRAVLYIVTQCLGCLTGSATLKALTPNEADIQGNLGLTLVAKELSPIQGFGVELFLGFVLVLVVFGVCDPNRPNVSIIAPLTIGFTVTLGHLTAVPMTGASMNPARTFGSAVVANTWTDHWVYWSGPILGGMAAALLYHHVLRAPDQEEYSPVEAEDREVRT